MHKKKGTVFISIGLLLIAASLILSGYNIYDDIRASKSAESAMNKLELKLASADADTVPDYVKNPEIEMPVVEIDGKEYVGLLSIEKLKLELPVANRFSYEAMRTAPCRYDGSAYMDNLVIVAHNYRSHFGSLDKLSIGDKIVFTDAEGNKFYYQVAEFETVKPTDIEHMTSGDWALTLFTCTFSGQARFTVRCVKAAQ